MASAQARVSSSRVGSPPPRVPPARRGSAGRASAGGASGAGSASGVGGCRSAAEGSTPPGHPRSGAAVAGGRSAAARAGGPGPWRRWTGCGCAGRAGAPGAEHLAGGVPGAAAGGGGAAGASARRQRQGGRRRRRGSSAAVRSGWAPVAWVLRSRSPPAGARSGRRGRCRCTLFEPGDPLGQGGDGGVGIGPGQADQGDLERDPGIERVLDADEGITEEFERPGGAGRRQAAGLVDGPLLVGLREPGQVGVHRGEEDVAEAGDERLTEHPGVAAPAHGGLDGDQRPTGVVVAERLDQFVDGVDRVGYAAGGHHPVEGGERVAGRPAAGPQHVGAALRRQLEAGVGDDEVDQTLQVGGGEEVDLEVLGAAADGRQDLLRIRGGQHEDDVVGRLLERLQQRVRTPPWRACGPRRGCTPWCAPGCRATPWR